MESSADSLVQAQLIICLVGALGILLILWLNGGRDANREPRSKKDARWAAVFAEDFTAALVLPADGALLSALAQKCEVALKSLLHDDILDLSHRELGDRDAPALGALLRANAALEELVLSHNALGDATVDALADAHATPSPLHAALRALDLSQNALRGEAAGEALARLLCRGGAALRRLNVAQNHLGDAGGAALARGVRDGGARLKKLVLVRNALGDQAAYALGAALASNKTLGALSLWGNERISAAAAAQLRAAWQRSGLLSLDDD